MLLASSDALYYGCTVTDPRNEQTGPFFYGLYITYRDINYKHRLFLSLASEMEDCMCVVY